MLYVELHYAGKVENRVGGDADKPGRGLSFARGTAFLLSRAGSLARRSWTQMLTERELTPHQYGVLMALGELDRPCSQHQLSDLIGIDSRNAVPIMDALVSRALLTREIDAEDRRRRLLALTQDGLTMVTDLITAGASIEARFFSPLSRTDQAELHRILLTLTSETGATRSA